MKPNENDLAGQLVIEWLKDMGFDYEFGPGFSIGIVSRFEIVKIKGL